MMGRAVYRWKKAQLVPRLLPMFDLFYRLLSELSLFAEFLEVLFLELLFLEVLLLALFAFVVLVELFVLLELMIYYLL